jgi:uncharacterized protein with PQ loop repeat
MSASAHLAIVASAIYLVRLLPQPIKTLRTGKVEGASWLGAANTLIADGAWFAYGLTAHIPPVWLVSIPAVAASAWTVALLRNEITAVNAAVAAAWLSTVLVAAEAGALGAVLTGTVLVTCGPHLVSAFRSREPAGVSRTTWRIAIADALSWGLYGVAIGNVALEGYGLALLATAILMLLRLTTVTTAQQSLAGL